MKKLVIVLLVLFVLAACAEVSTDIRGQWKLISYGTPSDQKPAAPDVETIIKFNDRQMNGNVGCNGFGGDYTVNGDTLEFGPVMSTMMFCEGPVGEQELETLAVLRETATFVFDSETHTFTITSADGESVIVLERK